MTQRDPAGDLLDAMIEHLEDRPAIEPVLEVDSTWVAGEDSIKVLIADDTPNAPLLHGHFAEVLLRVTVIARGRSEARSIAAGLADWVRTSARLSGVRINNVSTLGEGRGRSTGNALVFFTVPAIVRPQ